MTSDENVSAPIKIKLPQLGVILTVPNAVAVQGAAQRFPNTQWQLLTALNVPGEHRILLRSGVVDRFLIDDAHAIVLTRLEPEGK